MFRLLTKLYASYANVFVLLCVLVSHNTSLARFISPEEASQEVVCNNEIKIYKDFTHEWTNIVRYKALNERARENLNLLSISYQEHAEKFKVIEASTTVDGKVFPVYLDSIEDKSQASLPNGFQGLRQVLIPYSNVRIGSEVMYEARRRLITPSIQQHYSTILHYGREGFWKESITKITSEIPLYLFVNDPQNVLKVEKTHNKSLGLYYYTITLVKPFTSQLTNELSSSVNNQNTRTYVSISSDNSWREFGNGIAKEYEARLAKSSLSDDCTKAINEAKKLKTEVDQINHITSFIQDKVKYLGDWITTEKGFYPRQLAEILKTEYGDCKDYSALTVAMLRKLGLQANFALVKRSYMFGQRELDKNIVSPDAFNHAIAYVKGAQGKVYWIDTTNRVSMAGKMFPDIAGRPALVLDSSDSQYIDIPPIDYKSNKRSLKVFYDYKKFNKDITNTIIIDGSVKMFNENALVLTGMHLYHHPDLVENYVYDNFAGQEVSKSDRLETVIPDLKSRIVKDLDLRAKYRSKHHIYTNNGIGISLPSHSLDIPEDSVQDVFIGQPMSSKTTCIVNVPINNARVLNAKVSSQWMDISRRAYLSKGGYTKVSEISVIKKSYITPEDRKSKEFKELVKNLSIYFQKPLLVIPHK